MDIKNTKRPSLHVSRHAIRGIVAGTVLSLGLFVLTTNISSHKENLSPKSLPPIYYTPPRTDAGHRKIDIFYEVHARKLDQNGLSYGTSEGYFGYCPPLEGVQVWLLASEGAHSVSKLLGTTDAKGIFRQSFNLPVHCKNITVLLYKKGYDLPSNSSTSGRRMPARPWGNIGGSLNYDIVTSDNKYQVILGKIHPDNAANNATDVYGLPKSQMKFTDQFGKLIPELTIYPSVFNNVKLNINDNKNLFDSIPELVQTTDKNGYLKDKHINNFGVKDPYISPFTTNFPYNWQKDKSGYTTYEYRLQRAGTLSGRVLDAQGRPQQNVWVYAYSQTGKNASQSGMPQGETAKTDANGVYHISHLPKDTYTVILDSDSLPNTLRESGRPAWTARALQNIAVQESSETNVPNMQLERGVVVRGTIKRDDGRPIAQYPVAIISPACPSATPATQSTETDTRGNYEFRVPHGSVTVQLNRLDNREMQYAGWTPKGCLYPEYNKSSYINTSNTTSVDFVFPWDGIVEGRVIDKLGKPSPEARILAQSDVASLHHMGTTDNTGACEFSVNDAAPRSFANDSLLLYAESKNNISLPIAKKLNDNRPVTFRLDHQYASIKGQLFKKEGTPAANTYIDLHEFRGGMPITYEVKTDAKGFFRFSKLFPKVGFALSLWTTSHEPKSKNIVLKPLASGETRDLGKMWISAF
jgi:Carboxypeptidase regulatory-like domain